MPNHFPASKSGGIDKIFMSPFKLGKYAMRSGPTFTFLCRSSETCNQCLYRNKLCIVFLRDLAAKNSGYYLSNIYGITRDCLLFKLRHPEKEELALNVFDIWTVA